ncbi:AarF/UbiB family protein [Holospora undulata]|uniref:ABC1 atypical kinase-like domain-containing protein n=1 Tax=Holospora undulata HU1 TaxID=1321371 RepID=A0A061JFV9_9PROT|nr:AarF/UbiB family protein [Holospora undulata]ETZ04585.1 hypothetical protein K737_301002 [Holospora undulata HU1]
MLIKYARSREFAYACAVWNAFKSLNNTKEIEKLWDTLLQLKGPIVKVLQVLSGLPGVWPSPIASRLQLLSSTCSPLSSSQWKEYLETQAFDLYPKLCFESACAGSLGQVHKVFWSEKELRACKIQYPNMTEILKQDFRLLEVWQSLYQWWGPGIDTTEILQHLQDVMEQELDYLQEGRWMLWFQEHFQEVPWIHVPSYYPERSSKTILMMSWLKGNNFSDEALRSLPQKVRNVLSYRLLYAWYHPFFSKGILHSDPHMGNYMWNQNLDIYMVDFGCVRSFSPQWVKGAKALYTALLNQHDTQNIYYTYFEFDPLSSVQKSCIDRWAKFLYGPFLIEGERVLPESMAQEGIDLLKELHQILRKHKPLRIPHEFLLLDRACVALGSALIRLKGKLCWKTTFQKVIEGDPFSNFT